MPCPNRAVRCRCCVFDDAVVSIESLNPFFVFRSSWKSHRPSYALVSRERVCTDVPQWSVSLQFHGGWWLECPFSCESSFARHPERSEAGASEAYPLVGAVIVRQLAFDPNHPRHDADPLVSGRRHPLSVAVFFIASLRVECFQCFWCHRWWWLVLCFPSILSFFPFVSSLVSCFFVFSLDESVFRDVFRPIRKRARVPIKRPVLRPFKLRVLLIGRIREFPITGGV